MKTYQQDRAWSDKFIPAIKKIVGPYLLEISDLELDTKQVTDLIVFKARDLRIAARVRDFDRYADRYGNEFTLRSKRESGAETELAKILKGFGDWLFYGFGKSDLSIPLWHLIDLNAFRYHLIKYGWEICSWEEKPNGDGTWLRAFQISSFPEDIPILVASSNAAN